MKLTIKFNNIMALIKCFHCGEPVSNQAVKCPHCGKVLKNLIPCKKCGELIFYKDMKCSHCGYTKPDGFALACMIAYAVVLICILIFIFA